MEKTYQPKKYESSAYTLWEKADIFKPRGQGEPFSIIMPPPNANGNLHAGHAVGYTLEDIVVRYRRMAGFNTLWLPGTDHAGIETQYVYERDVLAKEGKTRFDLGADKFYAEVMKFTKSTQENILKQMRAMGWSADWSKLKFTLDEDVVAIVIDTFKRLHKDGFVYRGQRIVNWCSWCGAAFSDLELDHPSRKDEFYTIDYGPVKIATTRPETIFADTAVAVNPDDPRYQKLIGQKAVIPLTNKSIPIIADKAVDPKVGTGALKVTPGHDANDYEIGQRHNLPKTTIINHSAELINVPSDFAGMNVKDARPKIAAALKAAGKLVKADPIKHTVAVHERCGTLIEPLLSEQWFLKVTELNKPVIKAIEKDQIKFYPARFKGVALDWLKNEHDWNISRQIWWGIRMPIFYNTSDNKKKKPYLIAAGEKEAIKYYGKGNYRPETDTFDTWFSSGQWPYAALKTTGTDDEFYPTTLMATAREILHKWVTRMVMFGIYQTGKMPFKNVYLWGLVTDIHGQKMSKSKGNVIDPLDMSAKYGTDALRLAGAASNTPGNDSPLSEDQIRAMRNYCNKLWNVARYSLDVLAKHKPDGPPKPESLADGWILTKLANTAEFVTKALNNYRLNDAANAVYHLLWDDFADWYIEASKLKLNPNVLWGGLNTILKLSHPFTPFITETIWQKFTSKELLAASEWPTEAKIYQDSYKQFEALKSLITETRNLRQELNLGTVGLFHTKSRFIEDNAKIISKLSGIGQVMEVEHGRGLPLTSISENAWLGVDTETVRAYSTKLEQKIAEQAAYIRRLEATLANKRFRRSAARDVVHDTKQRLAAAKEKGEFLIAQKQRFSSN